MAQKSSLKTEKGLSELNALLAERSFVAGTSHATAEDLARFVAIHTTPDQKQFPHLLRWHKQIKALRAKYADTYQWPAAQQAAPKAPKGRAAGKERQELGVDCQVKPMDQDKIRVPTTDRLPSTAGSACLPGSEKSPEGRYYITTAINYSNGWPHIGHAFEALTADVFARYHRMLGQDVFFMTGADEHGQKIAQKAEDENLTPLDLVNRYADGFQALNQRLLISNDFYVRTTAARHKEVARAIWKKCKENGDIYLDRYEGWYLVREERFITDQEAQEWDYKDPSTGLPLKKMSEPSFFFRLSKYQKQVIKLIEEHEEFIQPQQYRTEILERLRNMEMRDLSISRGTFEWGVECPEEKVDGKQHVMYVWFDALINYMSGVDGNNPSKPLSRFWPADMHIVGKDISWFHSVIWPSMLTSAGMKLPKSIVVHGFIAGADGRKMSKSFGNVIDPHEMLDKFPCDTLRWYLCREAEYGDDVKFSIESLKLMHNSELCDKLGNLVNRAVTLCQGSVPEADFSLVSALPFDLAQLKTSVREAFEKYRLGESAYLVIGACARANKWIADLEPWKMKAAEQQTLRSTCLRLLLEAIYVLAHFFAPYIPTAAEAVFQKLGTPPRPIRDLRDTFANLEAGTEVKSGSILFEQFEVSKTVPPTAPGSADPGGDAAKAVAPTKEAPAAKGEKKQKGGAPVVDSPDQPLFSKLDVRVGRVVKAWHHPEAERLFCEEIDVGEAGGPRQIVSGLREHYSLEQFEGRKLLVVCNMKPSKLRNVLSSGMVLCAKNPEKNVVELLSVPDTCSVGDRVLPEGVPATWAPMEPDAVKKFKIWEEVAKDLKSDADRVACFAGAPLVTAAGERFLAPTQAQAPIS